MLKTRFELFEVEFYFVISCECINQAPAYFYAWTRTFGINLRLICVPCFHRRHILPEQNASTYADISIYLHIIKYYQLLFVKSLQ